AARASGMQIATMFVGFDGQSYASLDAVRQTVGLLNPAFREHRIAIAGRYAALAKELGAPSLAAHIGFIPETSDDPRYALLVEAVQRVANSAAGCGLELHLETGQESAALLLRFMQDAGCSN